MEHVEIAGYPDTDIPLDVTITNSTDGMKVTTELHNGEQNRPQYQDAVLENGRFHWATLMVAGWFYGLRDYYDTTATTCDATGTVTSFHGTLTGWVNAEHTSDGTFTLTRTG